MTALCGGGTSSPKPATPNTLNMIGSQISDALTNISPWLLPFALLIDSFTLDSDTLCASDPPVTPAFDDTDNNAIVNYLPGGALDAALSKIHNAIVIWAWYQYCACDSGSAPAPSRPAINAPPDAQTPSAPIQQQPCFTGAYNQLPQSVPSGCQSLMQDISLQVMPTFGTGLNITDACSGTYRIHQLNPSITSISWTWTPCNRSASTPQCFGGINFYNGSGAPIGGTIDFNGGTVVNFTATGTAPIPTGAVYFYANVHYDATSPFGTATSASILQLQVWCGGGPGSLSNCCPPDPALLVGINAILTQVNAVLAGLPAILHSYADSTVHGGLSGSGSVVFGPGTIGFRVGLSTVPAHYGSTGGTPNYWFDLGWVTPAALSEPFVQQRAAMNGQVFPLPAAATEVFYTLNAGVVISVTELIAGP